MNNVCHSEVISIKFYYFQEIQDSLEELELSFKDHGKMESRGGNRRFGAKCFIENNGKVNCSDIIYEDEKSWKLSRVQIDLLIKVLKHKISDLKDIKKHLKEHKPIHLKDYDEIPSIEDDDSRPLFRKYNNQNNIENRTLENGEERQFETTLSETNKNRYIEQKISFHSKINTTTALPRIHNLHQRQKGNRSHLNSFRQHHGRKVNLEDLFADNKAKDKSTTIAPAYYSSTNSLKESEIEGSSTSNVDTEMVTEATRNYFDGLESSTKVLEDFRTESEAERKMSYEISGKFQYFTLFLILFLISIQ